MPDQKPFAVYSWECRVADCEGIQEEVIASTAGRAKSRYYRKHFDGAPWIPYTAIRVRCLGKAHAPRGERLMEIARRRGMPFVHPGMAIEVDGRRGRIWDGNDSGNFDVLFDGADFVRNCHPWWRTRYFDGKGNVLADYVENTKI